jgi:hypothetical protein
MGLASPRLVSAACGCSNFAGAKSGTDEENVAAIHEAFRSRNQLPQYGRLLRDGAQRNAGGSGDQRSPRTGAHQREIRCASLTERATAGHRRSPKRGKELRCLLAPRLGVEAIDIYQPGRIDPNVPVEDTVGAIADLIKEGKVRYLGLSETGAENVRRAHKVHPVTALEIEYCLGARAIEKEILPTVRELGIGLVAHGVVGQGLVTGAIRNDLPTDDFRRQVPRFDQVNLPKNLEKVAVLQNMARRKNCTASQLAIAWVLVKGEDIVPLVGMSRRARLAENLKALGE